MFGAQSEEPRSDGQSRTASDKEAYVRFVKPVLRDRCYACHGALKQEAGLRLDSVDGMMRGGTSGISIVARDAESTLLLHRIASADLSERMPPEGEALTGPQIEAIRKWIAAGALHPQDETPEQDPREHWSFQRPTKAALPRVANAEWQSNPIDAFLAQSHETHGLVPNRNADRRTWLRRATLDLIGLPPTPDEYEAFIADESSSAVEEGG